MLHARHHRGGPIRRPFVYPLQTIGYLERVEELLEPIRKVRNLVSIGRQGLYRYCNMNECMEMAMGAAEEIDAGVTEFTHEFSSRWRGAGLDQERVARERRGDRARGRKAPAGPDVQAR